MIENRNVNTHSLPIVDTEEGHFNKSETIRLEDCCMQTTQKWKPTAQCAEESNSWSVVSSDVKVNVGMLCTLKLVIVLK